MARVDFARWGLKAPRASGRDAAMILRAHASVVLLGLASTAALFACGDGAPNVVPAGATDAAATDGAGPAQADAALPAATPATLPCSTVLGNPTNASVEVVVLCTQDLDLRVEAGVEGASSPTVTPTVRATANLAAHLVVGGLAANTAYAYRVRFRAPGAASESAAELHRFVTQRAPGETFTFTIQSDSHRDENSTIDLYRVALANMAADRADFHVDLGDTFMTEKFATTQEQVVARYRDEHAFFGLIGADAPLLLVNGNHEGEQGWALNGTANNVAVWATKARLAFYANPIPDGFYTGDATSYPFVGKRGGYYAWTWGDALFIALDPFWFTKTKPGKQGTDGWTWTLGEAQYRWLEQTLQNRTAKYVFVFSHHMVGGLKDGRGGTEAVEHWEWGGKNAVTGVDEFAAKRPGWSKPVGQLLADANVSAWFHGHDHLYVKQDWGRTVYQEVPQPSHRGENGQQTAAQWGYTSGKVLSSSGHLRVTVAPAGATVEYVKAFLPSDATAAHPNREVADRYVLPPRP